MVQTTLDFSHADIDALSAGDIVQAITIPADTCVLYAGAEMIESVQSSADGNTVNLGITDVDQYVAAVDIDDDASNLSSGLGYLTASAEAGVPFFLGSADTLDLELQATSTAPNAGKIRIFAMLMDISPIGDETVNAFAADGAVDVDRDLLA
jgi:hypothetical protein